MWAVTAFSTKIKRRRFYSELPGLNFEQNKEQGQIKTIRKKERKGRGEGVGAGSFSLSKKLDLSKDLLLDERSIPFHLITIQRSSRSCC